MTQQDKREMFQHSLNMLVLNAHKHGMSWKKLHEDLSAKTSEVLVREGFAVHHLDGDLHNNAVENLLIVKQKKRRR